jgi:hypothetical protein
VTEDSQTLLGIGDDGKDPHLGTTAGTAQGVNFVDFYEQPCPGVEQAALGGPSASPLEPGG